MDDFELLQSYAGRKAEDAFRSLTERYVHLVYSAAVRQTGNPESAKDVTQAVFLTLAAKAGTISRRTVLAGWLLRTTRYAAANLRRLEQRRQQHEQQVMPSFAPSTGIDPDPAWQRIAPLLDDALEHLGDKDRDAVVLRFFEQMPLRQVAQRLGVSEDTAQKRVSRALDKLRGFFARHGRNVSIGAIASALGTHGVEAAPATLVASICAAAIGSSAPTGSFVAALTHATLSALASAQLRRIIVRAGSAAVLSAVTLLVVLPSSQTPQAPRATPSLPAPPTFATASTPPLEFAAGEPSTEPAPPSQGADLLLRVVDTATATAVPNARLTLMSVTDSPQPTTNVFATDADGVARVTYSVVPVRSWSHRIEIYRDGYVPKYVSWSESQQDRLEEIPAEYTARLDPAVTIGGVVTDEQDAPISGVRVVFSVSGPVSSRARERLTMMGDYHSELTGVDGRWSCQHVPARFGRIDFKPIHPRFQEKRWTTDSPDATGYVNVDRIPEADFLAGRARMRLKPGLVIAGIVTDENGQPVDGAKVSEDYEFQHPDRSRLTSADGAFHFGNGRPGNLTLTVQAPGLGPVVTSLDVNAQGENLRIRLPAGRPLRGLVFDDQGTPVTGATIEPASPSSDSRRLFEWRSRSDAAGRFAWDAAPALQEYAVSASGYETRSQVQLEADGTEQLIRLTKKVAANPVRIYGQVTDAETERPPAAVRVQIWETGPETSSHGGFASFTTVPEAVADDGQFRLKTSPGTHSYVLEVQADGYWPQRITNQVTGEREVNLAFALTRAPVAAGVVLTPEGEPAASATLVVCGHHEFARLQHPGKLVTDGNQASVVADAQGRFRLPAQFGAEVVVVAHAAGFGEVPCGHVASNTVIRLQPWGRIEGTARAGATPLAHELIRLNSMLWRAYRSPRVSVYLSATTDADGRFVFAAVPPGEWKVMREINPSTPGRTGIRVPAYTHGAPIEVRAGETATPTLGGSGRPVIGRAVVADAISTNVWVENSIALILKVETPGAPRPPKAGAFPRPEFQAANEAYLEQSAAYWNSELGLAQSRRQREYRALFAADGRFRLDDVPPGDYTVKVNLVRTPPLAEGNPNFTSLATLEMGVTIPEPAGPSDEAPVSLGELTLIPAGPTGSALRP